MQFTRTSRKSLVGAGTWEDDCWSVRSKETPPIKNAELRRRVKIRRQAFVQRLVFGGWLGFGFGRPLGGSGSFSSSLSPPRLLCFERWKRLLLEPSRRVIVARPVLRVLLALPFGLRLSLA